MNKKHAYHKLMSKYKKQFSKLNKEVASSPWDYGPLMDFILLDIRFMREYYLLDYNVIGDDVSGTRPPRIDTLTAALDAYDHYLHTMDEYVNTEDMTIKVTPYVGNDNYKQITFDDIKYKYTGDPEGTLKKEYVEERKRWKAFWKIISDHILEWWD